MGLRYGRKTRGHLVRAICLFRPYPIIRSTTTLCFDSRKQYPLSVFMVDQEVGRVPGAGCMAHPLPGSVSCERDRLGGEGFRSVRREEGCRSEAVMSVPCKQLVSITFWSASDSSSGNY